jgi:ribA/ribD-fused uncharacterized protein
MSIVEEGDTGNEKNERKRKRSGSEEVIDKSDAGTVSKRSRVSGERYFWPTHSTMDFLSNGYESPFVVDGMKFRAVDWYMWYARAKMWQPETDLAVLIREAKTIEAARMLSRKCTSARLGCTDEWSSQRLKIMAKAVMRKFECSLELSSALLATGRSRLVYAAKFDAYYGIGFTMKEGGSRREEWGMNYLGEMLMLVRERLRERGIA